MGNHTGRPSGDPPAFYASGVGFAVSGTDVKLVFTDNQPTIGKDGDINSEGETFQSGVVTLSFHTVKDLHALLGHVVQELETRFGRIDTPYLQQQKEVK